MNNIFKKYNPPIFIQLALSTLRAKKARSLLTILGISIGVAVVIVIMAAGRGLDKLVMSQLEVFNSDTISIETKIPSTKKTSNENSMGQSMGVTITTLKDKDLEDVLKHPMVIAAYGYVMGQEVVTYDGLNKTVLLMGEGYQLTEVEKFDLASGRMFTKEEEDSLSQLAILGWTTKQDLFGEDDAVGKNINIKGKSFRVIGVAKKRGAAMFMDMDSMVLMPAKTMQRKILGIDYWRAIVGRIKNPENSAQTVVELEEAIRENHNITDPDKDDFAVNTMAEAVEITRSVVSGITLLLVALVCVSLVVGGVGIMNIMYVSVTERVFEIGLRKALGAKRKDILYQFLAEAVLLTLLGAVAGIILGAILALVVYIIAKWNNLAWVYSIPISSIILAVGFSGAVGLAFGLYPAKKAAALDPIVALRKE